MTMIRLAAFASIVWLFQGIDANGQGSNFDGFVVEADGDTLSGIIGLPIGDKNPERIKFTSSGEEQVYKPIQLKYVELRNGARYVSRVLSVDKSAHKLDDLEVVGSRVTLPVIDTVLLKVLVEGPINLYRLHDENGKVHFFVGRKGQEPVELIRKFELATDYKGQRKLATTDNFKGQLRALVSDCNNLYRDISESRYQQTSLIKILRKSSGCERPPQNLTYVSEFQRPKVRCGLVAGITMTKITLEAPGVAGGPGDLNYPVSSDPTFGFFANILPGNKGNSFLAEALYQSWSSSAQRPPVTLVYKFSISHIRINASYRRYLRYGDDLQPFFQAGVGYGQTTNIESEIGHYGIQISKSEQAVLLGAGLKYKFLALEGRFDKALDWVDSVGYKNAIERFSVLASINF